MKTPPQILWEEAGEPTHYVASVNDLHDLDEPATCAVCGGSTDRAVDVDATFGGNEDGWEHFASMDSAWCCPGCHFISKGRWADNFRLWSLVWRADGGLPDHYPSVYETIEDASYDIRLEETVEHAEDRLQITNRGRLDGILDTLLDPPDCQWWMAVTTGGQKKVHRFAPLTYGDPWRVQVDYQTVEASSEEFAETLFHCASLRALGVAEERIRSGRLDVSFDADQAARAAWHADQLDDVRGHPRLDLALFCLTKETIDEAGRRAGRLLLESQDRHRRRLPRRAARLARRHRAGPEGGAPRGGGEDGPGDDEGRGPRRDPQKGSVEEAPEGASHGGEEVDELRGDGRRDGRRASREAAESEDLEEAQLGLFDDRG